MTLNDRIKATLCELLHINGGWHSYETHLCELAEAMFRCGVKYAKYTPNIGYIIDYDITITKEDYDQWVKQNAIKPHAD